jgi:hypothetical protein
MVWAPNPGKPELKIEDLVDVARAAQALAPRVAPSFLFDGSF